MSNPVDAMSMEPPDGGFVNYPPQTQLPPSVQVIVNNPPQSLPQVQSSSFDPYAVPTNYRPSTDANIGQFVHPALRNTFAAPQQLTGSRYQPSIVYPSMSPGYSTAGNGVASTDVPDPNLPHDPTEAGSR